MKKLISIVLAVLFCLSFAACTGKQPEADPTAQPTAEAMNTAEATEQAEGTEAPTVEATAEPGDTLPTPELKEYYPTYAEVYDPETDYDNNFARYYSSGFVTDDTVYYSGYDAMFLYYYDKASGEGGVVCSKPECMHDNDPENKSCDGFLHSCGETVCLYNDRIYFSAVEGTAIFLYSMKPDGTDRKKLFEMDCEYQYHPQRWAIHRGKLYGSTTANIVVDAEPISLWSITSWDIGTGEFKLIYEDRTHGAPSTFFFGDYVYFCVSYWEEDEYDENGEEIWTDETLKELRYDTVNDRVEKVFELKDPCLRGAGYAMWVAAENKIYFAPYAGEMEPTAVFMYSDGNFEKVVSVESGEGIALFESFAVAYSRRKPSGYNGIDWPTHIAVYDYEGNTLFDDYVPIDIVFGITEDISNVTINGCFASGGDLYVQYGMTPKNEEDRLYSRTCLVRYELKDGKLEDTLIAVAQWD